MSRITRLCCVFWLAASALPAVAHPFQSVSGSFASGFAHPFMGLDHLLAMIAVGAWAVQQGGSAMWRVPLAFCTGMALGAVLGYLGLAAPLIEPLIAGSVFALGLLILNSRPFAPAFQIAFVGFFALFHGAAHAMEQVLVTVPWLALAGLLGATVILHLGGMLSARALRDWMRVAGVPLAGTGLWLLSRAVI
jgi:urease accessory protein